MNKGQGSLEYILLIAGAILGAAVVIGIFITITQSTEEDVQAGGEVGQQFIDDTIEDIKTGLGPPNCGDGELQEIEGEECDPPGLVPSGVDCGTYGFTGDGTLECGTLCNIRTDNCSNT